jgi:hypothetical protein
VPSGRPAGEGLKSLFASAACLACGAEWHAGQSGSRKLESVPRSNTQAAVARHPHGLPEDGLPAQPEEGWTEMARLQEEGNGSFGISDFNVQQIKRAQGIAPVTSLQPPYSIVTREIEHEILPYAGATRSV